MREVLDLVKLVASNDTTAIITGESGTDKKRGSEDDPRAEQPA